MSLKSLNSLSVSNLGQIKDANVEFGDLTVLIGPQASGKSIFVQLLKLVLDSSIIRRKISKYGYSWDSNDKAFLDLYFGEGMRSVWKSSTRIATDHSEVTLRSLLARKSRQKEKLFLIPAQRVMTIQQGWPRNFMSFEAGDPYVVKSFSEDLRLLMEHGLGGGTGAIFPQEGRMKASFRNAVNENIFYNAKVKLDKSSPKKRFVLSVGKTSLPYMTWSAGQREFMPLLLGLYWLMPSSKISTKEGIKWVVIEEPEMGLHPKAIQSLLLMFLELIDRGYKVIVSTHSPVILEFVWLIRTLQETGQGGEAMFDLFQLKKYANLQTLFKNVIVNKTYKTYYFDRGKNNVSVQDISSLDALTDDPGVSDWGGLTAFSSRVSELVSESYMSILNK